MTVGFKVDRNGLVSDIFMQKSSGSAAADHAAMEAIEEAAPFPKLPPGAPQIVQAQCTMRVSQGALALDVSIPELESNTARGRLTHARPITEGTINSLAAILRSGAEEQQMDAMLYLKALGRVAEPATPAIEETLKNKKQDLRKSAFSVLESMGTSAKAAVPTLICIVNGTNNDDRTQAAVVLGAIGPAAEQAIPALLQALDDDYLELRKQAARTLKKLGPKGVNAALPPLIKSMSDFWTPAPDVLPEFGADAIPALAEALKAPSARARANAAKTLRSMADIAEPAIPALTQAIHDQEGNVREEAMWALAEIGPPAKTAVPDLIEALKGEGMTHVRAIEALGAIGPDARAALPFLKEDLKLEDADDRRRAQDAIKRIEAGL